MKARSPSDARRLEDLPNIGKSISKDLRSIGILTPQDLVARQPVMVFRELADVMGSRHDPCVLYTLLAVEHFMNTSEALSWARFAQDGKRLLQEER